MQGRGDHGCEKHERRHEREPVFPQVLGAAQNRGEGMASDGREAEHRDTVRDHIEQRSGERQRERPIERVFAAAPELLVAARAARRSAGRELWKALQQVTIRAGDK